MGWMRQTIKAYLDDDGVDFQIAPPEPYWARNIAPNSLNVPAAWVVRGLGTGATRALVDQFVLSTPRIMLFCHDVSVKAPRHAARMGIFVASAGEAVEEAVYAFLCSQWVRDITLPLLLNSNPGCGKMAEALFEEFIVSVELAVKRTGKQDEVFVNVYCDPPTWNASRWILWATDLRRQSFPYYNRLGLVKNAKGLESIRCAGCHASDHWHSECTYVDLLDWKGAPVGIWLTDEHSGDNPYVGNFVPQPPQPIAGPLTGQQMGGAGQQNRGARGGGRRARTLYRGSVGAGRGNMGN